eukprot:scaffold140_cov247-Pinguiococcus_pyrenoidosus.AAC.1
MMLRVRCRGAGARAFGSRSLLSRDGPASKVFNSIVQCRDLLALDSKSVEKQSLPFLSDWFSCLQFPATDRLYKPLTPYASLVLHSHPKSACIFDACAAERATARVLLEWRGSALTTAGAWRLLGRCCPTLGCSARSASATRWPGATHSSP